MIPTNFTRLVGCAAPIQMAGIGGGDPALVAAVSNAGALGMLGAGRTPIKVLEPVLQALRSAIHNGQFGVNFLGPFLDPAYVEIAAEGSDVVEFFYETPSAEWVRRVHDGGALASWQVGSPEEAQAAINSGCDFIVAQGVEAGGHVRGNTPVLTLLDQIGAFATIPFLAAGNMSSGVGLAAAMEAGAAGVRIGTRFLTATESDAHPQYIDALLKAKASDTVLTEAFSTGWPDAPHRVLQSCVDAANDHEGETVGSLMVGGQKIPLPKFHTAWPNNRASGNIAAMCHYAGQSVETVNERQTAAYIVDDIVRQAEKLLGKITSPPNA